MWYLIIGTVIWAAITGIVVYPYEEKIEQVKNPVARIIARIVFAAGAPAILISGMVLSILDRIMPEDWQD